MFTSGKNEEETIKIKEKNINFYDYIYYRNYNNNYAIFFNQY